MKSIGTIQTSNQRMAVVDLESKLLQGGIIFITGEINEETVSTYQAELMYLADTIKGDKTKSPIKLYINSPGGECYSALGLYDVMQNLITRGYIIQTKAIGLAASAASLILNAGSPGYRTASAHSKILIHQPSSATWGTVTDMEISLEETVRLKKELNDIMSKHSGKDISKLVERDKWLTPEEALELGIIDKISL